METLKLKKQISRYNRLKENDSVGVKLFDKVIPAIKIGGIAQKVNGEYRGAVKTYAGIKIFPKVEMIQIYKAYK